MKKNPLKAELVQHLPDILRTGEYLGSIYDTPGPLGRHSHQNVIKFHYFTKKIQTSLGVKQVVIDVRELKTGEFVYDLYTLNYEGFTSYAAKKKFLFDHGVKIKTENRGRYAVVSSHCQYPFISVWNINIPKPGGGVNIFIVE